jgi:hypothetical protein
MMIYARVHDRTVAEDYYAAMDVVEKRLEVIPPEKEQNPKRQVNNDERTHLLKLATQLAKPELGFKVYVKPVVAPFSPSCPSPNELNSRPKGAALTTHFVPMPTLSVLERNEPTTEPVPSARPCQLYKPLIE